MLRAEQFRRDRHRGRVVVVSGVASPPHRCRRRREPSDRSGAKRGRSLASAGRRSDRAPSSRNAKHVEHRREGRAEALSACARVADRRIANSAELSVTRRRSGASRRDRRRRGARTSGRPTCEIAYEREDIVSPRCPSRRPSSGVFGRVVPIAELSCVCVQRNIIELHCGENPLPQVRTRA